MARDGRATSIGSTSSWTELSVESGVPVRARAVLDSNLLIRGLLRRQRRSTAVALLDAIIDG